MRCFTSGLILTDNRLTLQTVNFIRQRWKISGLVLFALWGMLVTYEAAYVQPCWINEAQLLNLGRSAHTPTEVDPTEQVSWLATRMLALAQDVLPGWGGNRVFATAGAWLAIFGFFRLLRRLEVGGLRAVFATALLYFEEAMRFQSVSGRVDHWALAGGFWSAVWFVRTGASADREAWGFVLSGALFAMGVLSWPTAVTLGVLLVPLAMQVQLQLREGLWWVAGASVAVLAIYFVDMDVMREGVLYYLDIAAQRTQEVQNSGLFVAWTYPGTWQWELPIVVAVVSVVAWPQLRLSFKRDRWMTWAFVLAIGALTAFAFATRFYPGRIVYWLPVLAVAAAWVFRAAEISKLQKGTAWLLLVFVVGQTSHRIFSRPTSFPRSAHAQWLDVVNAAGIEPHHRVYTDDWAPLVVSEGNFIPVRAEFSIRSPEALEKLPICDFVTVDPTRGLEEFLTNLGFSPLPIVPVILGDPVEVWQKK